MMLCPDTGIMLLKFVSIAAAEELVHVLNEDRQRRQSLSNALRTGTRSRGFYWRFAAARRRLKSLMGACTVGCHACLSGFVRSPLGGRAALYACNLSRNVAVSVLTVERTTVHAFEGG